MWKEITKGFRTALVAFPLLLVGYAMCSGYKISARSSYVNAFIDGKRAMIDYEKCLKEPPQCGNCNYIIDAAKSYDKQP